MSYSHAQLKFDNICLISQTEREKSRLFCWREIEKHPSFLIGPMKMEFVHRHPDVVMVSKMRKPAYFKMGALKKLVEGAMLLICWFDLLKTEKVYEVVGNKTMSQLMSSVKTTIKHDKSLYIRVEWRPVFKFDLLRDSMSIRFPDSEKVPELPHRMQEVTGLELFKPGSAEEVYMKSQTWAGILHPHFDSVRTLAIDLERGKIFCSIG